MTLDRPDMLDPSSLPGIRVRQVTPNEGAHGLIYPDQPSFLHDGRRLIIHGPNGPLVCDPAEGFSLRPLFNQPREAHSLQASPCGRYVHFHSIPGGADSDSVLLQRIEVDTGRIEEILLLNKISGAKSPAGKIFRGGITLSQDGKRCAMLAWLGDGKTPQAPCGIVVVDFKAGEARVVFEHPDFLNAHLQYRPTTDPVLGRDLMAQHNHGVLHDATGKYTRLLGPPSDLGVDIHVIRDDGTHWRDLPWGRDGKESCIGHQLWRGSGDSAVSVMLQNDDTTYGMGDDTEQSVVEGWPIDAPLDGHRGLLNPGCKRRVLSEGFEHGRYCHLHIDPTGNRFAFDSFPVTDHGRRGQRIYSAFAQGPDRPLAFRYLCNTGGDFKAVHAHPMVSPDGKRVYFNSGITGVPQVYAVEGESLFK